MEEKFKILLCEDDENLGTLLSEYLQAKGYQADLCPDGEVGYKTFLKNKYDICVLDVMMPKKDGFTLAQEIRQTNAEIPIIFLTAKQLKEDILAGFKIGADDYIVKPFSPGEIIARINAILRRITPKNDESAKIFIYDNLEIDLNNFTVKINDEIISLTKKEIEILWTLATNQNKVFTRENLLDLIWGFDYFGESRTVDTHIKRLRATLDNYKHDKWNIKTIWGVGYKFDILEK